MPAEIVHVAAGAVLDHQGRVLLTRRHEHVHQGGLWEFPGGKLEAGEDIHAGMRRELHEELGIDVTAMRPLIKIIHHYDDISVCLDVYCITAYEGEAEGREGQPLRWANISTLDGSEMPPADVPVINALKLPERYLITGKFDSVDDFAARLQRALDDGIRLVQLRIKPDWYETRKTDYAAILATASQQCAQHGAILMLNVPEGADTAGVTSCHADSRRLQRLEQRPAPGWFSASCHSVADLKRAEAIGADFAVLSPVQHTRSHPDTEPLGWEAFASMIDEVNIPVYALGGVDARHVETARDAGAQGVAGIGAFWQ